MLLLIADPFPDAHRKELEALGLDVVYDPRCTADDLVTRAAEASVVVVRSTKVTRAAIERAKNLALIVRAGAGYDTIDLEAASERGIYVSNCPGKNSVAVAELTMGLILALDRRIPAATADLRAGRWNKKEYGAADGLKGKTLGLAGFGRIGQAVARRALAFEMELLVWSHHFDETQAAAFGVERCGSLAELAERADIVSVHLPQTPETKKLFGADFFARMKKGATFINTARGGLHDQPALVRAARERGLRVGLDVFDPEPAEAVAALEDELFALPHFVGTHHIGASTDQAQNAIAAETVHICREFVRSGRVPHVVNVEEHAPAKCQLIVRHHDRVGVLASVFGIIRNHGANVEDMTNTIFKGAKAAVAVIRLSEMPDATMLGEIAALKDAILQVEAKAC